MVAYADDIDLMGRSLRAAKEVFEDLNTEGKKVGLNSFSRGAARSHTTTNHTR
jgi:hypothetical protein